MHGELSSWRVHELELACAYRASNDEEQAVGDGEEEEERDAGCLNGCNLIDARSVAWLRRCGTWIRIIS